jgi:hypothetical protein
MLAATHPLIVVGAFVGLICFFTGMMKGKPIEGFMMMLFAFAIAFLFALWL